MKTLALDPITGDLLLNNGKIRFTETLSEYTATKIRQRLLFFRGEYFLDQRLGTPWLSFVFVKNPDLNVVRQVVTQALTSIPEILRIVNLEVTYDSSRRTAGYSFEVVLTDGARIQGNETGEPYLIFEAIK